MIDAQTMKPDRIELVNDEPISDDKDITWRYRLGYERIGNSCDIILFMENDDWYSPNYIETMFLKWLKAYKPDIFGTDYTVYYHIYERKWFTMWHHHRSSAMSTLLKANMDIPWCEDKEPYTDLHLWRNIKGVTFHPKNHICLGIKHNIGLCGGVNHATYMHRYANNDDNLELLRDNMDVHSFDFYSKMSLNK
jgi:glycosyltransferase involved in cell wall biosynthesis